MKPKVIVASVIVVVFIIFGSYSFLESNVEYTDIEVDARPELRREMMERSGRHTVPQIWIGDTHVGGYDDMARLEQLGELDGLIKQACDNAVAIS